MDFTGYWIWYPQNVHNPYNQTVIFKRSFETEAAASAELAITADTSYRLIINGQWVNDGPARCWPEHYKYDVIDVGPYLLSGTNTIEVIANYAGVGYFHAVPRKPGLLAQLSIAYPGQTEPSVIIATDRSWQATLAPQWVSDTMKTAIQLPPAELYDATQEAVAFVSAEEICHPEQGPWKNLEPRDVALLRKHPVVFEKYLGAHLVKATGYDFCVPMARILHDAIEANFNTSTAGGIATVLKVDQPVSFRIFNQGFTFKIVGAQANQDCYHLEKGAYPIVALVDDMLHPGFKEKTLRFLTDDTFRFVNPLDASHENSWSFVGFNEFQFKRDDLLWYGFWQKDRDLAAKLNAYNALRTELLETIVDDTTFMDKLGPRLTTMPSSMMFVTNPTWQFDSRQVLSAEVEHVTHYDRLIKPGEGATTILPPDKGDLELAYDVGMETCGYVHLDVDCETPGTIIDINLVEAVDAEGNIQFTEFNRNGMRYICKAGRNQFTSLRMRAGRYVFITVRHANSPVKINHVGIIESTYPTEQLGAFSCDDDDLNQIWQLSIRTLELCMYDAIVDCPLYERTLWVGDARNESLYNYAVFHALDISKSSLRIAAQSLERYPIVGAQVPSCWDFVIPAWSFLWGIAVWEYYWQSGDAAFLQEMWPYVLQNIEGAKQNINQTDLFASTGWNFFDWSDIDCNHEVVLHNSMLLVGCIDAAIKTAQAISEPDKSIAPLRELRSQLIDAINTRWNENKQAYPDSIYDDGMASDSTSMHTSILALLYDIIPEGKREAAVRNILEPPTGMIQIGSPFVMQYYFEALEKIGKCEDIIDLTYKYYKPMLDWGATTVWETFATGNLQEGSFPTRSHCHAWSSSPMYFLARVVLGLRQTEPGGKAFVLSPSICALKKAQGVLPTMRGPIAVAWELADRKLTLECSAPSDIHIEFVSNPSLEGLDVQYSHKTI